MLSRHAITTSLTFLLATLLTFTLFATAAPLPPQKPQPFRFDISTPHMDTLWPVDSLPAVAWDASVMPQGSTLDIALLHHEKKQSILLRRYVPASKGSTLVNLRPEIVPGTYSLLLTVFKGRTSTVLGRSLVHSIILVEDESVDPELEQQPSEQEHIEQQQQHQDEQEFLLKKKNSHAIQELELVQLTHEPERGSLVLRAPYTVGWTVPKALEHVRQTRVNILLVSRAESGVPQEDTVVKVLATNVDAKVGFLYVFLPEDVPLKAYSIKVEIVGQGRKFSGYTRKYRTSASAFSSGNSRKA